MIRTDVCLEKEQSPEELCPPPTGAALCSLDQFLVLEPASGPALLASGAGPPLFRRLTAPFGNSGVLLTKQKALAASTACVAWGKLSNLSP